MSDLSFLSAQAAARLGLRRWVLTTAALSVATNALLAGALLCRGHSISTVLIPSLSEASEQWHINEKDVSPRYLELLSRDILHLACNVTPDSVDYQRKQLLSFVLPQAFGELDIALQQQARRIHEARASLLFDIRTVQTDVKTLTSVFTGTRRTYIGDTERLREPVTVTVAFRRQGSRLWLAHLSVQTPEQIKRSDTPASHPASDKE